MTPERLCDVSPRTPGHKCPRKHQRNAPSRSILEDTARIVIATISMYTFCCSKKLFVTPQHKKAFRLCGVYGKLFCHCSSYWFVFVRAEETWMHKVETAKSMRPLLIKPRTPSVADYWTEYLPHLQSRHCNVFPITSASLLLSNWMRVQRA